MIQCNNLEVALPKIAWKIISQSKNTRMTHLIFIFEVMIFSVLNYDKQQ